VLESEWGILSGRSVVVRGRVEWVLMEGIFLGIFLLIVKFDGICLVLSRVLRVRVELLVLCSCLFIK
jgi:hypothetical protein